MIPALSPCRRPWARPATAAPVGLHKKAARPLSLVARSRLPSPVSCWQAIVDAASGHFREAGSSTRSASAGARTASTSRGAPANDNELSDRVSVDV
jgi:hypothetical protein